MSCWCSQVPRALRFFKKRYISVANDGTHCNAMHHTTTSQHAATCRTSDNAQHNAEDAEGECFAPSFDTTPRRNTAHHTNSQPTRATHNAAHPAAPRRNTPQHNTVHHRASQHAHTAPPHNTTHQSTAHHITAHHTSHNGRHPLPHTTTHYPHHTSHTAQHTTHAT